MVVWVGGCEGGRANWECVWVGMVVCIEVSKDSWVCQGGCQVEAFNHHSALRCKLVCHGFVRECVGTCGRVVVWVGWCDGWAHTRGVRVGGWV